MKKNSRLVGKPRLIYSPVKLRMANEQVVIDFGRLDHVPMDIDELRTFADFKVIEIVDEKFPYPTQLGIDWAFDNFIVINLKKRRLMFEGDGFWVIAPLDPEKGCKYTKHISEEGHAYELENIYKMIAQQQYYINPTKDGNLSWKSESACLSDLEQALEKWHNRLYQVSTQRCARLMKSLNWIGTSVSNICTFDGLNNLEVFIDFFKELYQYNR